MTITSELHMLAHNIKLWGQELGFDQVGITDCDLHGEEARLETWLAQGYHGQMEYMARYGLLRARPAELLPGTRSVISVRMNYLPPMAHLATVLADENRGYISRYALGQDYHKVLRQRLKKLGDRINEALGATQYRPFVDSAPVMERPLAEKAGLGWTGKHTLLINRGAGSFFFLGELLVDLPLPIDQAVEPECGSCSACLQICPTQAIVAPYELDARRCISYLTIEHDGPIPEEFRPLIGNRIYGCDDCQLICPWNRYALQTSLADFSARPSLHTPELLTLWHWDEAQFLRETEGSAIRRIGFQKWQRNLAIALGNSPYSEAVVTALEQVLATAEPLVAEHIVWALTQQQQKQHMIPSHDVTGTDKKHDVTHTDKKKARLIRCIHKGLPDHA